MTRTIELTVVACPNDPNAVVSYPAAPGLEGVGPVNLVCGNCSVVLVKAVYPEVYAGTIRPVRIIRCPSCDACNELPADAR